MNKETYIDLIKNAISYLDEEQLHDLWKHTVKPTVLSVTSGTEQSEQFQKDVTHLMRVS